jgi:hypothetical protein
MTVCRSLVIHSMLTDHSIKSNFRCYYPVPLQPRLMYIKIQRLYYHIGFIVRILGVSEVDVRRLEGPLEPPVAGG